VENETERCDFRGRDWSGRQASTARCNFLSIFSRRRAACGARGFARPLHHYKTAHGQLRPARFCQWGFFRMAKEFSCDVRKDERHNAAFDLCQSDAEVFWKISKEKLAAEQVLQSDEIVAIRIGHGAEPQAALFPGNPLIAVPCAGILIPFASCFGPDKNTDEMFSPAVD